MDCQPTHTYGGEQCEVAYTSTCTAGAVAVQRCKPLTESQSLTTADMVSIQTHRTSWSYFYANKGRGRRGILHTDRNETKQTCKIGICSQHTITNSDTKDGCHAHTCNLYADMPYTVCACMLMCEYACMHDATYTQICMHACMMCLYVCMRACTHT